MYWVCIWLLVIESCYNTLQVLNTTDDIIFLPHRYSVYHWSLHQLCVCRGTTDRPATETLDQEGRGHAVCPQLLTVSPSVCGPHMWRFCTTCTSASGQWGMWVRRRWGTLPDNKDAHCGVPSSPVSCHVDPIMYIQEICDKNLMIFTMLNIPSNFSTCIFLIYS